MKNQKEEMKTKKRGKKRAPVVWLLSFLFCFVFSIYFSLTDYQLFYQLNLNGNRHFLSNNVQVKNELNSFSKDKRKHPQAKKNKKQVITSKKEIKKIGTKYLNV